MTSRTLARIDEKWNPAVSRDEKYVAHLSGGSLQIVDLTSGSIVRQESEVPAHFLDWSPDGQSLILDCYWGTGGLWLYNLKSQSLSRVFKGELFGESSFSCNPNRPGLAFTVAGQRSLLGQDIWMAEMSSPDPEVELAGSCHTIEEHHEEIIDEYGTAIEMDPNEPMNYLLRGERYLQLKEIEKALMDVEHFARLEQNPELRADPYLNRRLDYIVVQQRVFKFLIDGLSKVQGESIKEDSPGRSGLAWSHFYAGLWAEREQQYEAAVGCYERATRIRPDLAVAFRHLARVQATCPLAQFRAAPQALQNAQTACELTAWLDPQSLEIYAAAHANAGDFNAAVKWQQEAINRLASDSDAGIRAQAQAKLDFYHEQKAYRQQYLWPNRLIAWWKFDGQDTQQVRDHSGNDLHGRFVGDACIVSDPERGEVLSLDGKGDFVDCGLEVRFNLTETLSICAWIKPRVFNRKHQALISNGDRGWGVNREAYANGMQIFGFGVASANNPGSLWGHLPTKTEMTDGQWHHLVGVYDGTHLILYVDGKLDAKTEATGRIRSNDWPVYIGENSEETNREWNGLLDDVRIYSYALSAEEIGTLYESWDRPDEASKGRAKLPRDNDAGE